MTRSGSGSCGCWLTVRSVAGGELRAPVAKSTLSHHLEVLRDAGVTQTRQEGTRCFVQLRRTDLDTRFPQLMAALLSVAAADDIGGDVTAAR